MAGLRPAYSGARCQVLGVRQNPPPLPGAIRTNNFTDCGTRSYMRALHPRAPNTWHLKPNTYTRSFFGGRHPLCGIGVTSRIDFTSRPEVASARIADSRPDPGPLTRTSTVRRPTSFALPAAVIDA